MSSRTCFAVLFQPRRRLIPPEISAVVIVVVRIVAGPVVVGAVALLVVVRLVKDGVEGLVLDGEEPEAEGGGDAVHEGEAGQALGTVHDHLGTDNVKLSDVRE